MVKQILLKFNTAFFYRMKKHKYELEAKEQRVIKWEEYIKILFGFKK